MDGCEEVVVTLVASGGNCAKGFEFAEEPLHLIALVAEDGVERRDAFARWHASDVGHGPAFHQRVAQAIAVIGAVGQQYLARSDTRLYFGARAPVMGLALGQFQQDRTTHGINKRMDLRGQPAA